MDTKPMLRLTLQDDRVQTRVDMEDVAPLQLDSHPPIGHGEGYTPLQLFLASLVGCTSTGVISLMRDRMRRQITAFEATADGTLREEHPKAFEAIAIHMVITSPDATEAEVRRALDSAEKKICPVWHMIQGNVAVTATFEIRRP